LDAARLERRLPVCRRESGVDEREANQQRRIEQRIKSGTFSPAETNRLERREMSIERQEQRVRARGGGELTSMTARCLTVVSIVQAEQSTGTNTIERTRSDPRLSGHFLSEAEPSSTQ